MFKNSLVNYHYVKHLQCGLTDYTAGDMPLWAEHIPSTKYGIRHNDRFFQNHFCLDNLNES